MSQMYLVSDAELNTLVRRRRQDVVGWVRQIMAYEGEELTLDERLALVEDHIREDHLGYDYQERDPESTPGDEFAALEEDDGEDDTAIDYALAHVDEDTTLRLLDVDAGDEVEVLETGPDEASTVEGVHVGEYPEFPSQHTDTTEYTAEDEPAAEIEILDAQPAPVPQVSEEEVTKRNAAAQRQLNREISQIDRDQG